MGIGERSFLIALSGISRREFGRCVQYHTLHKNSPLLTRLSLWPNVTCSSVSLNVGRNSSSGRNDRNKVDPVARYGGLNPASLKLGFDKIKDLEDADERVKRIFSLEYADDTEILAYRKNRLVQKIQKDPTDYSLPVRIALTTLSIRAAAKQYASNKKDTQCKKVLLGCVGRRRKQLKFLRRTDYERFEKLLVELGITYTLPPPVNSRRKHTRRYLEKLTVWRKAREQRIEAMGRYLREQTEGKKREIAELNQELGIEFTEEEMKYIEDTSNEPGE